jgi:hypothetical protein
MPSRFLDGVDDPRDFIDGEYDRQTLRALCPHQVHSFSDSAQSALPAAA